MTERSEFYVDLELDMEALEVEQNDREFNRSDTDDIDDEDNERVNQALYGENSGVDDERSS